MKSLFIGIFCLFLFTACGDVPLEKTVVHIGNQQFICELASTKDEIEKGLMFRQELPQNTGMLFDLGEERKTGFWMKNTLIPLDIIWISKEKKVLYVVHADPCESEYCEIFQEEDPARWILEINAGEFQGNIDDSVKF